MALNVLRNTPQVEHITKGDIFKTRVSHSDEKIWWKCSYASFTRLWDSVTCWLAKEILKWCFLKSGLTKSFTVCNFRNKVAMRISFLFIMFKIWCGFENWNKKIKKFVGFIDKIISIGDDIFTQSRTEYLSLAVDLLRKTPKI